ncbi:sensor domain-containing diguanylate cyclase [Sporosarcina oncorhynchi]|uniref:Sensor domain-containing diguanylate cyclase n=1 Tax=Sporosarcina oncorhynchi TaxID=3056444 RepID=A0ABZ0L6B2_9BACL|nr:sensor domain-containing diguanylate cyclase [Sporosarcina sp. T2O-4]WOV88101.1 sensor domain-containing diguanylate cyclase [Sporosarcina sp. T2O-4]
MIEQRNHEIVFSNLVNDTFLILELTEEGKVLDANKRFLALTRFTLDEIITLDYQELTTGCLEELSEVLDKARLGEKSQGENRFITKCGDVKWLESTFIPIMAADGSVEKILTLHQDITDVKLAAQWKRLAYHNELTGLPNRRSLYDAMDLHIWRAQQMDGQFAVLFMDLNRFKSVNDQYGHRTGDQLIIEIGRRLSIMPYTNYGLFHMSGDEFIILIEDSANLDAIIKEILTIFEKGFSSIISYLNVSVSIGISLFPEHATNPEQLIELADRAMYEAKSSTHNEYRFADESIVTLRK